MVFGLTDYLSSDLQIFSSTINGIIPIFTEELKSLLKVKEENEKAGLKPIFIPIFIKLRLWHSVPSLYGKQGESGNSDRFYSGGLQNHCGW